MDRVLKTIIGVTLAIFVAFLAMSAGAVQRGKDEPRGPVIKRLATYRGDHFPGFAEFRFQEYETDELGALQLAGDEPYDVLLNVSYFTGAYRFEDVKGTDYSTLVFTTYQKDPILIRQPYKDVVSSIRKGMEALTK